MPVILLLALLAALACGGPTPTASTPQSTASRQPPAIHHPQFGVAGLIPRNFPNSSAADWINLYETLPETGALLGTYTDWTDSPEKAGQIPDVVSTVFELASRYHFTPVIALGFFHDMPNGNLEASLDLADPADRALFKQTAAAVAERYRPPYLALGNEVNRYHEFYTTDFENYVTLYAETYDAVKAISPDSSVFPIFQLETLKGNGYLLGNSETRQPQWEILDRFGDRLDLAAFTTYPFLDYQSPTAIPDEYYAEIAAHTSKLIAFTEIGWPSAPLITAPDAPYGGSEEEQAEFVRRFFELTSENALALVLWSFPHDLGPGGHPTFNSVSLRQNDGTPKRALAVWQEAVKNK